MLHCNDSIVRCKVIGLLMQKILPFVADFRIGARHLDSLLPMIGGFLVRPRQFLMFLLQAFFPAIMQDNI